MKPPLLSGLLFLLVWLLDAVATQPATLSFDSCASGEIATQQINISTVYGQIVTNDLLGKHLNLTAIGVTGQQIIPMSTETGLLGMASFA